MPNQATSIGDQILASLFNVWATFVNVLPEIITALLVFIVGLIIAAALGSLTRTILSYAHMDEFTTRSGLADAMKRMDMNFTFSWLIGKIVQWFFIFVFLLAAVDILGWEDVTIFLRDILLYIPNILVAVIILAVGFIVGNFLDRIVSSGISASRLPISNADLLGTIAKVSVITFAILAALLQLGIAASLIQILFAGLVLAMALAFGLGGKDKAHQILDRLDTTASDGDYNRSFTDPDAPPYT